MNARVDHKHLVIQDLAVNPASHAGFVVEANAPLPEFHQLANAFPLLGEKEFKALVEDIKQHGVREDIWFLDGQVLDGRNRLLAARKAGVDCRGRNYQGARPVHFVMSLNLPLRRNLNASQAAIVGAKIADLGVGTNQHSKGSSLSQGEVADMLGIARETVVKAKKLLDSGCVELVAAVESNQVRLDAASLVSLLPKAELEEVVAQGPKGVKKAAAKIRAEENGEWFTPPDIVELARSALGDIDLDPASCEKANEIVRAGRFYTSADNGLVLTWSGRVWLNPPDSDGLMAKFAEAAVTGFAAGDFQQACVLVNNDTEAEWFQRLLDVASAVCVPRERIKRIKSDGVEGKAAKQGQAIFYLARIFHQ